MTPAPSITISQVGDYVFTVDFGKALPALRVDEAEPIGGGTGPHPEQLLIAGVANCLCASLVFALGKFRQDGKGVSAEATCRIARNEADRLRIVGVDVRIALGAAAADMPRIHRVLDQFQRFCTVSESVKLGIPIAVSVHDGTGTALT
ncbi:OsmC family protein [Methylobacterium sp. E-041]|uniref:OsmC family protein n=1 Tax=unclassified Methylobacterium TaxID=2615210 RepID=UPI0011C86FEC|nr:MULTISPECIES: OsmC family protein [unclassified Methylobacterium]MCJ2107383.1 OsmC family protein [Methylobacterium sp. E-041]TXM93668.1 OsmC family protein [Methylobacterium sp. WL116]TXN42072.1 OsmC family protein [Methylobacterium sp. WL93]TXN52730.1 OsmC family protein [Methylobacterium sp. WL119]TXN69093.1 OsmC family protein [Methylobacterium sp. WL30]